MFETIALGCNDMEKGSNLCYSLELDIIEVEYDNDTRIYHIFSLCHNNVVGMTSVDMGDRRTGDGRANDA